MRELSILSKKNSESYPLGIRFKERFTLKSMKHKLCFYRAIANGLKYKKKNSRSVKRTAHALVSFKQFVTVVKINLIKTIFHLHIISDLGA